MAGRREAVAARSDRRVWSAARPIDGARGAAAARPVRGKERLTSLVCSEAGRWRGRNGRGGPAW